MPTFDGQLVLGTLIAFACAVVAVAIDLQDAVRARMGGFANTSVLLCWQGWLALGFWGLFDAIMYHVILHNKEWASRTFGFTVEENLLWTGLAVGLSAVIVIRSKLAKIGNVEIGGEFAYLWSRAKVLDAVNRRRIDKKQKCQGGKTKDAIADIVAYRTLFTDLEVHLRELARGRPDISAAVISQIDDLRKTYIKTGDPDPDKTINENKRAREYLVNIALDYFGHRDFRRWTKDNQIPI
jgi:hypothetical protein